MRLCEVSIILENQNLIEMDHDARGITVKDIMTKSVISVDSTITVNEAAKMMEDAKVGAVIVMENNTPVELQ
jgi:CBS domain-containing protein